MFYLHVVNAAVHCYFCLSSHVLIFYFLLLWVCCFAWAFSSRGERELLFIALRGLLIVVLLLLWSTGSKHIGVSSGYRILGSVVTAQGSRALELQELWHTGSGVATLDPGAPEETKIHRCSSSLELALHIAGCGTGEYRGLFIFFSNAYERVTTIDQMLHCEASIDKNSKL